MNTFQFPTRIAVVLATLPVLFGLGTVGAAEAQVVQLDEGTFEILQDGERIGTESFTIRRIGMGATATIVLQGRTQLADSEIEPILETSPEWEPLQYRRTIEGARNEVVELVSDGRRYTAVTTNERGEGEREFRPGPVTVVLDAEVAFLYHAVAALADADVITVVHPDQGRQARFRVEIVDTEGFRLGSGTVPVRRIRLSSGDDVRDVLVDDRNRVMAVEIPGRDWIARRLPD
ncbi:MAG TPA: hypothetical protein VJ925_14015 [Longimicrobiales bacterium]|nr:hypothetical protein [Longimicrobiales bacterium]